MMTRTRAFMSAKSTTALIGLTLVLSCTPKPSDNGRPLLDDRYQPDILTDSREIPPSPTYSGHRYLRGWWPWKREGKLLMVPYEEGAWIELVNVGGRERSLTLDIEILGEETQEQLRALGYLD